jgi:hypothetical protein
MWEQHFNLQHVQKWCPSHTSIVQESYILVPNLVPSVLTLSLFASVDIYSDSLDPMHGSSRILLDPGHGILGVRADLRGRWLVR